MQIQMMILLFLKKEQDMQLLRCKTTLPGTGITKE